VTFTFFSIQERLQAKWVQPNYWSTQILTGHGNFHAKLLQLGLIQNSLCKCGTEEDTVWHFILECLEFEAQRIALRDVVPHNEWKLPEAIQFLVSNALQTLVDFSKESL